MLAEHPWTATFSTPLAVSGDERHAGSRCRFAYARSARRPAVTDLQRTRMLSTVGLIAFALRLLNTQALLEDPLFYNPLGGNVPYLEMAQRIAGGDWVPDGAFTVNSPLYAYLVALVFKIWGVGSLYAVRLLGAVADAGTCVLVALLAARHFGVVAGWAAGLLLAVYGPAIFFAGELAPVPFTLLLLTAGVALVDGGTRMRTFLLAGLVLGLATGMRPNLLIGGLLALGVPWARGLPTAQRLTGALALGLVLGVAPVTLMNAAGSGGFTLLTLSGGHNLYIGHNPRAEAQYALPSDLDGDVFESMRVLAEEVEGRPFTPGEVSGYYGRRAIAYALSHPVQEVKLTVRRALLLLNDFEATTYASLDYQRHYSPLLRWTPTFAWLLALSLPGMLIARDRSRWHLWIPPVSAAVTVLSFFYIARLRVVMVPALAIFAGAAVGRGWTLAQTRSWGSLTRGAALAAVGFGIASLPLLTADTSNDWNKAGGTLRLMGRYDDAESALGRARIANPNNPSTYMNLAALYRQTGRAPEASEAEAQARALMSGTADDMAGFREGVQGR